MSVATSTIREDSRELLSLLFVAGVSLVSGLERFFWIFISYVSIGGTREISVTKFFARARMASFFPSEIRNRSEASSTQGSFALECTTSSSLQKVNQQTLSRHPSSTTVEENNIPSKHPLDLFLAERQVSLEIVKPRNIPRKEKSIPQSHWKQQETFYIVIDQVLDSPRERNILRHFQHEQ